MGSFGEDPNKGIDAAVGGLVWVCRRNGSWWPGRILGPDDLPEGSIPTSRAGAPVKLLGRDDASVDWYNLEKSKRVKAFRCGQFDNCIEKAKESASASHLHKAKPVKYARREDAILEALELESIRLGVDLSVKPDTQHEDNRHDGELFNEETGDDSESALEMSQSGVSFQQQNHVDAKKDDSDDDDDDGSVGVKRLRGIEDLGMSMANKMKRKGSFKEAKGREFLKRKNRSRSLTKVLECTAMTGSNVPEALESHDSKKKNSVVINTSDSTVSMHGNDNSHKSRQKDLELGSPDNESLRTLFDVPIVAEKKNSTGATTQSSQSSHIETIFLGKEEPNDSGSTSSGTANVHTINHTIKKGTTEWQLKGKRNSRSRKIDIDNDSETRAVKSKPITEIGCFDEFPVWSTNAHRGESSHTERSDGLTASSKLLPYRQSRFKVNPKYNSPEISLRNHVTGSGLYEVNIEVKTGQRPQQVPYISLMSKLNGRPIIGHPVEIELLEDGFCDNLMNFPECYSSSSEKVFGRRPHGKPPAKQGPLQVRKSLKKKKTLVPRKNGLLSKKMRKLSSFSGLNKRSEEGEKKLIVEKVKRPVIACAPLNVVFSRINADLSNSIRCPAPRLASVSGT